MALGWGLPLDSHECKVIRIKSPFISAVKRPHFVSHDALSFGGQQRLPCFFVTTFQSWDDPTRTRGGQIFHAKNPQGSSNGRVYYVRVYV